MVDMSVCLKIQQRRKYLKKEKIYTSHKFIRPVCEKTHEHILMSCVDDVTVSARTAVDRDKWVMLPSQGLWQVDRDTYRSIYSG